MRRIRLFLLFIVTFFLNGLHTESEPISISAGEVSHQLTGLNRAIEKTESWMNDNGILTTVITLKPQEARKIEPIKYEPNKVELAHDYVPVTMNKDVVQDRFWKALKERLSIDKTAKSKFTIKPKIVMASNKPKPQPEPQLPTDVVEPQLPTDAVKSEEILSPQERKELDAFNQSLAPQPHIQQVPQQYATPYVSLANQDYAMTLAMQMQMSAQALSNQAAALMMQNNQRGYMPVNYQPMPAMQLAAAQSSFQPNMTLQQNNFSYESASPSLPRQEKMSRLMGMLNQIMLSGVYSMQRLLVLIDLEVDIIERLLAGETGSRLEKIVEERNKTLTQSAPMITSSYDAIVDLATTDAHGESDSRLYHYFVRSGNGNKQEKVMKNSKKKFLLAMMYAMKHYQEMIESMYNVSRTALPSR